MKALIFALIFSSTLISCQVKKGSQGSGLISGHVPVENAFTVTGPANGSYRSGQVLSFTLTHPYEVDVTGAPRIALTVGGSTVYADYVSGTGSKVLTFSYTVAPGVNDTNGIDVVPTLDLNGGSIKFNTTTDVPTTLNLTSTVGVKVDTAAATVTAATKPAVTNYYTGLPMVFTVTFSEPVVVTGTPSIDMTVDECTVAGSQTKKANYLSGSGTDKLTFSYTVENTCNETTNIPVTTTVQLNGGTIQDAAGNTANPNFAAFISSPIANTTQIRGRYPVVSSITAPPNATYGAGQTLEFKVNLDRAVTVTGTTAYLPMILGAVTTKQVQYVSGSGTNQLTFRYVVIGGDVDADGVVILPDIINEGTICSGAFCLVNNQTDAVATISNGVLVSAPIPSITNIQVPAPLPVNGYYKLGEQVQVVVQFSEPVVVAGGTPRLAVVVGSTTKYMNYLSGSGTSNLIFTYTVANDDTDRDGNMFSTPLDLNGATIQNLYGTNADMAFTYTLNANFRFDGIAPTITGSVIATAPAANHPNYRLNQFVYIDVTFDEDVTVAGSTIGLTVGGTARTANFSSDVSATVKRFRYQVQAADHASQLFVGLSVATTLTGGTVRDTALNDIVTRTMPATNAAAVKIDGAVPAVASVTPFSLPANGTYRSGQTLSFTVNFTEAVTVTGTPTWAITLAAGGAEAASYSSGSGTSALVFTFTVDSNDLDLDGIDMATAFTFASSSISDVSVGNSLNNTFTAPTTTGILVDGVGPTISSFTAPAAGTYIENQTINFTVNYSEAVVITGSPQLTLNIGGATRYATYSSGSGTSAIVYQYTVEAAANLNDKDGVQATANILNAGSITDVVGNVATLTMSTQTFATTLVDTVGPVITSITPPTNGTRVTGNTLSFTVNYDENVIVSGGGTPRLPIDIGGVTVNANYLSGSGSSSLVFTTAALTSAHFDADGIAYSGTALSVPGGTNMRDIHAHDASETHTGGVISGIKVIYSQVSAWYEINTQTGANGAALSSFTDRSLVGNNASAGAGTVTKTIPDGTLNSQASASFNGTSTMTFGNRSYQTLVVALRTNGTPTSAFVFGSAALNPSLELNGSNISIGTTGRVSVNNGAFQNVNILSGYNCSGCFSAASTKIIMVDFGSGQSLSNVLGSNFNGRIAEVFLLDANSLSDAELAKITAYLSSKY